MLFVRPSGLSRLWAKLIGKIGILKKLLAIANAMNQRPQQAISRQAKAWAAAMGTYRFLHNARIQPAMIQQPSKAQKTGCRLEQTQRHGLKYISQSVQAIQDFMKRKSYA